MTTPIILEKNRNIILKIYNALSDSKNVAESLIFKSQILNLFLKEKEIFDFLINPEPRESLSLSRNDFSLIISDNYFLIYYFLYYKQSSTLNIDTFINEVFDKGDTFFEYNILPITKQTKNDINNLGYYNGKQFIISHHPSSNLNFRFEDVESVFFEKIGNIDFSKTILDLEEFKKFLDIIYNKNPLHNSYSFLETFTQTVEAFLDTEELSIDISDSNKKSQEVFDALNKITTTNLSKTIGINVKSLTLGEMVLMSPAANPNYKTAIGEETSKVIGELTASYFKSPVRSLDNSSYFFNNSYFAKVIENEKDNQRIAQYFTVFNITKSRVLEEGTFKQEKSALNNFFMHTETLFSLFDNTPNTFFNVSMISENNFKIKKEDDSYKQEVISYFTNSKLQTKIDSKLTNNFKTTPLFDTDIFKLEHEEFSDGAYRMTLDTLAFDGQYGHDARLKAEIKKATQRSIRPSFFKYRRLDVLNNFFKKEKENNNTLSYIKSSIIINDEGISYLQINTEFFFVNIHDIIFTKEEFDFHCMVPVFEVKTVKGTIPFEVYSEDTTETVYKHFNDKMQKVVLKKVVYRCPLNKIRDVLVDSKILKYNNISKFYNKKLLFNYNLHLYEENTDGFLTPANQVSITFEEMQDSEIGEITDYEVAVKSLSSSQQIVTSLFDESKRLDAASIPDSTSDKSSQEVSKIRIPLRITSDTYSMPDSTTLAISAPLVEDLDEADTLSLDDLQKISDIPLINDEDVLFNDGKRNIPAVMKNIKYGKSISYHSRCNNIQPRLLHIIYKAFLDTKNKFPMITDIIITSGGDPPMWKWAETKKTGENPKGYSKKRRKTMRHDLGFAGDVMLKRTISTDRGLKKVHVCIWQPHDDNDFLIFKFFIEKCRQYGARGIGAGRGYMDYPSSDRAKAKASITERSNGIHVDIAHLNPTFDDYLENKKLVEFGLRSLGVSQSKLQSYPVEKRIKTFSRKNDFWGEDDTSASAETWLRTIFGAGKASSQKFDVATIDAGSSYLSS